MGIFSDLNDRITRNIEAHGHYLINHRSDHPIKLEETVDLLMVFVRPEDRDQVKAQIVTLISEHRSPELRLPE